MRVVLMGSVSSSYNALSALIEGGVSVGGVLGVDESRSARISGYCSLEPLANEAGIPFLSFSRVSEPAVGDFIARCRPDMLWVVGLSQLVPDSLVRLAPMGGVGLHPTLLPEGRGRAPIVWTLLREATPAACLFHLTDEADAGDLIMQRPLEVRPGEYAQELLDRVDAQIHQGVLELAPRLRRGDVPRTPQDHSRATHYPKRTPPDGVLDWTAAARRIERFIRAVSHPYPGAFCRLGGETVHVWRATRLSSAALSRVPSGAPGTVVTLDERSRPVVIAGDGELIRIESATDSRGAELVPPLGAELVGMPGGCWDDPLAPPPRDPMEEKP